MFAYEKRIVDALQVQHITIKWKIDRKPITWKPKGFSLRGKSNAVLIPTAWQKMLTAVPIMVIYTISLFAVDNFEIYSIPIVSETQCGHNARTLRLDI